MIDCVGVCCVAHSNVANHRRRVLHLLGPETVAKRSQKTPAPCSTD